MGPFKKILPTPNIILVLYLDKKQDLDFKKNLLYLYILWYFDCTKVKCYKYNISKCKTDE